MTKRFTMIKKRHWTTLLLGLLVFNATWAQLPTAQEIASKVKIGWNLGNTLEAIGGETAWGNPKATQRLIDSVKAAGFSTIRLPVSWDSHANSTTHIIDSAWMARVKEVVDYCIKDSLYVFINIHYDNGWLEKHVNTTDSANVKVKQKAYWTQIATYFKDYDEHLLFASANEPNASDAKATAILMSYHQVFIDAVRATGGNNSSRTLIIQGPDTDMDKTNSYMNTMPVDTICNRLMVEVHYYTPWNFCGMSKDETWGKMFYYWGNGYHSTITPSRNPTWGEESDMAKYFDMMKVKFVDKGIPVIIGEYGASARKGIPEIALHNASREFWYKTVVQYAVNRGLIPYVWDTGDIINRNTGAVKDRPVIESILEGAGLFSPAFFTLDTSVNGIGSINLSPNLSKYKAGSIVTITAIPGTSSQFDNWSGDITNTTNPDTLVMNANYSVTANFSTKTVGVTSNLIHTIQLYPNPFSSTFTIKSDITEEILTVDVFDIIGKKVESINGYDFSENILFGNSLPKGLYEVRIRCKRESKVFKIIKE